MTFSTCSKVGLPFIEGKKNPKKREAYFMQFCDLRVTASSHGCFKSLGFVFMSVQPALFGLCDTLSLLVY